MMKQYAKSPWALAGYHLKLGLALTGINAFIFFSLNPDVASIIMFLPALFLLSSSRLELAFGAAIYATGLCFFLYEPEVLHFGAALLGTFIVMPAMALFHNAAHANFRPKWLNRPMGELMALLQLTGWPEWKIVHLLHHAHADDANLDPHPPLNKSFWKFAFSVRESIQKAFGIHFIKKFGESAEVKKALKVFSLSSMYSQVMKSFFWFLVLGPQYFAFFLSVSIVSKYLQYSWFNYVTHKWVDGKIELQNLDSGIYRFMNFFTFGLYAHRIHHRIPYYFDPRSAISEEPEKMREAG